MQEFCQPVNRGIKESMEDYKLVQMDEDEIVKSTVMAGMRVFILTDSLGIIKYDIEHETMKGDTRTSISGYSKDTSLSNRVRERADCDSLLKDNGSNRVYLMTKDRLYQVEETGLRDVSGNNILVRNQTWTGLVNDDVFMMANGRDGIDLYSNIATNSSSVFRLSKNYNSTDLSLGEDMDIRDIQVRQGYLYLLCHNTGVHVYDYKNSSLNDKVGDIPMRGGESFKLNEQNTLLFVMGHSGDYWIKEVVITIFDSAV